MFANEIRYPLCLRKGNSRRIIFIIRALHPSHVSLNRTGLCMLEGIIVKNIVPFRESDLLLIILGGSSSHTKYKGIR